MACNARTDGNNRARLTMRYMLDTNICIYLIKNHPPLSLIHI